MGGQMLIRGRANLQSLEAEVHFNLEKFEFSAAEEIQKAMEALHENDRFGSLLETTHAKVEKFQGDNWGRQRRKS